VITLHGCNGALDAKGQLNPVWHRDAGYFNAEQMHLLVLDSFTPRGVVSLCEIPSPQRKIQEEDRRDDVFAAIQWLAAQPAVDKTRLVVMGRSHGGSTVLSVVDKTDKAVQRQALQPRAAVALYPGCGKVARMWHYEVGVPLLVMAGALDDWTPASDCVTLRDRTSRAQGGTAFELVVYPESHHGFDGTAPVATRMNVGNTRSGTATVGGNAQAREQAHGRMFDFLSRQLGMPLRLSHAERLYGHRHVPPAPTGFARIDDLAALPLNDKGRARYEHYLGLGKPKAFVISEKHGWYFSANDNEAMKTSLEHCERAKVACWLYAVDDQVVWSADVAKRTSLAALLRKSP
jgi:dienelactone hydrolase